MKDKGGLKCQTLYTFCLYAYLVCLPFRGSAQQSDIKEVIIDTVTHRGIVSAPFDRPFSLKLSIDAKPKVDYLSISEQNRHGHDRNVSKRIFRKYFHWLDASNGISLDYEIYNARISKKRYLEFLNEKGITASISNREQKSLVKYYRQSTATQLSRFLTILNNGGSITDLQHSYLTIIGNRSRGRIVMPTYLEIPQKKIQIEKGKKRNWAIFEMFPVDPDQSFKVHREYGIDFQLIYDFIDAQCNRRPTIAPYQAILGATQGSVRTVPPLQVFQTHYGSFCVDFNALPSAAITAAATLNGSVFSGCVQANTGLNILLNKSLPCNDCEVCTGCNPEKKTFGQSLDGFVQAVNNLYSISTAMATSYLSGELPLNHKAADTPSTKAYTKVANFKLTVKYINQIIDELKTIDTTNPVVVNNLIRCLEQFKVGPLSTLEGHFKMYADFKATVLKRSFGVANGVSSTFDSNISDFDTRSKLNIVPTFGLISYGFQFNGGNTPNFWGVSPYLGFQVNFRPTDKNIPLKNIRYKSIRQRFSFQGGWMLVSLEEEGIRENLFKNSSFMTGLGFKLSNALSLSGGILLFKEVDPNPLIDNTSTAITPYAGLTVDLDINKYLNDFTGLFK